PWQLDRDPYRVWLSEVMLQQTQVATVLRYYPRFLQRFPDVAALAAAPLEQVLELWAGLGYYSRARQLHACARIVAADHGGRFPDNAQRLQQLPGIGRSTAAAIAAFCFDERVAILDGNVRRVLARQFGIEGATTAPAVERELWRLAESLLPPAHSVAAYTQAIMDLGATVCTRAAPRCDACPVADQCIALRDGRVRELPAPRPARRVPLRRAHLLLALQGDAVLVEQRPATGIWGGLLSLPEFGTAALLRARARRLGVARPRALAPRRHGFTHFTLEFTPHLLKADPPAPHVSEATERWLPLDRIESAALPAPILGLLRQVRDGGPR
ncbi:MAG TPA: A/G-specific adenine glycosylase, partial [Burkholderiaceae bacterium]